MLAMHSVAIALAIIGLVAFGAILGVLISRLLST
jgi:hypothetical protein